MLMTTTPTLEGKRIREYHGVVSGDAIIGVNIFRDLFARVRDIIGGRAAGYEQALQEAKAAAMADMADAAREKGANAVVGIDLDYETVGDFHADGRRQRHRGHHRVAANLAFSLVSVASTGPRWP